MELNENRNAADETVVIRAALEANLAYQKYLNRALQALQQALQANIDKIRIVEAFSPRSSVGNCFETDLFGYIA
jgi:hypothetical protein